MGLGRIYHQKATTFIGEYDLFMINIVEISCQLVSSYEQHVNVIWQQAFNSVLVAPKRNWLVTLHAP